MPLVDNVFPTVTLHTAPESIGRAILAAVAIPESWADERTLAGVMQHDAYLQESEISLLEGLPVHRRASFVAGRVALRSAVASLRPALQHAPLLRTIRGAPSLPPGIVGSISHKRSLAVAFVALEQPDLATIGVDLEDRPTPHDRDRPDLSTRILTTRERLALQSLDPMSAREETLLRFAIKEAVYKAIDPHVHRHVHFTEVEVDVRADGTADVHLILPELQSASTPLRVAWWRRSAHLVAMAVGSRFPSRHE